MQTSLFVALRAASAICESSLSPKLAAASWRRIGLEPGAKWDRDVIFVNRAAELFVSQRDASAQQTPPKSSSSAVAIVESVSPEKSKCCCGQWVYSNHRFCPNCKAPNEKFVEQDFATLKAGWHKGWKVPATTDIATPSGQDAKLLTQVDDLMRELRKRSASADEGLPSAICWACHRQQCSGLAVRSATTKSREDRKRIFSERQYACLTKGARGNMEL